MKTILTAAFVLLLATSANAKIKDDCTPAKGNWIKASPVTCPGSETSGREKSLISPAVATPPAPAPTPPEPDTNTDDE